MALLPQLKNASGYRACDWDLVADAEGRKYWLDHFCQHLAVIVDLIRQEYAPVEQARIAVLDGEYVAMMNALRDEPARYGRLDVLLLDELRNDLLARHGFEDPFHGVKRREDMTALALLPGLLAEIDALPTDEQLNCLIEGLFAGNIFDLGSMPTVERYRADGTDFRKSRADLPARPWLRDDVEAFAAAWQRNGGYRHVLLFVDNAGGDVCLGCLPLARWMLRRGARVTLAANTRPALNDITAEELRALVRQAAALDGAFGDAGLRVAASGNGAPLIDLAALSEECVAAGGDADLVMLHGMGRSLESNYTAEFVCDSLRTAIIKDEAVARHVGGRLFDCVFRFERAM